MPRMMRSIEVQTSPNKVRDYLWDAQEMSNYMPITRIQVEEQTANRRKLRFALDYGEGPVQIVAISEINSAGRKIKCYALEGMTLEQTWVLQQTKRGTQVTYIVDYEPVIKGFAGMLRQGRSRKRMYQVCCASLERLRYHLERQTSTEEMPEEKARNLAA